MKATRALCLIVTLTALLIAGSPPTDAAAEGPCCAEFEWLCAGFCIEHGGVMLTWCPLPQHWCHCSDWESMYAEGVCPIGG
jgi:hypothetical protein